ncbi:MAG: CapA family protein [Haloferacaceae archaeon]
MALTLAAAGDALATRRLGTDERARATYDRVRAADVGVVNLEMLLHDYEGHPAAESVAHFSGTYLRGPPWVADELADAGFDLFAAASNHTGDYSHGGMRATMRALEERDLAYAGLGRSLAAAREPAFVDTPEGRVALVAAVSTVTPGTEAGPREGAVPGRPGVCPLRLERRHVVPPEDIERLRTVSERLGLEDVKRQREEVGLPAEMDDGDGEAFGFLDVARGHGETLDFVAGDDHGVKQVPRSEDRTALLESVAEADRQADHVVVSLHAHEGENGAYNDGTVAPFVESVARDCVDAGADAFVGHGPHTVRGIELYDGAPLLYSLGDFITQYDAVTRQPPASYDRHGIPAGERRPSVVAERILDKREYFESVLAVCELGGDGAEVALYPVEEGFDDDPPIHGEPRAVGGETAERVLERVAERSEPYGTEIEVEDGVGYVRDGSGG